jgi:hypothetical protein
VRVVGVRVSDVADTCVSTSSDFESVDICESASIRNGASHRLTSGIVLQGVLIVDGVGRVVLSELQNFREVLGKVSNNGVGDLGNVEESVATCQSYHSTCSNNVAYIKSMDQ